MTPRNESPAVAIFPVDVSNLRFETDGQVLIDNLDLHLQSDTRTVIMGPNGAGKSLLLRLLHGLVQPSSGHILWAGKPSDDALRRKQAMVFQRPVMLRRSVAANIDFALNLRGRPHKADREQILRAVDLFDHRSQSARSLSGGEQQRLALGRALATRPQVLFLDEPTANLDPAATAAIEKIVTVAHENGTKIVFVTHDIGQARRLADDILFMHQGRLIEQSSAEPFFSQPGSREARHFLAGELVL